MEVGGGAVLDNDEPDQYCQMMRARLARRRGIREEPVAESPSIEPTSPKPGGHGLGRIAHPDGFGRPGNSWIG